MGTVRLGQEYFRHTPDRDAIEHIVSLETLLWHFCHCGRDLIILLEMNATMSHRWSHNVTHGRQCACRVTAGAAATLGLVLQLAVANAEERPVLVVDATEDGRGAAMAARIQVSLGPDPTLAPIAARFIEALRKPTPLDLSWRIEGEAALVEARAALAQFAYRQAADRARAAQDVVANAAGDPGARNLLADLAFAEGIGIAGESGLSAATPTFELVHRLDPGRTLDRARYLPELVQAFAAAAVPSTSSGSLLVTASGAAEVLIDGVAVGPEPATVSVSAGPHIVTVRGPDIEPRGRRVESAVDRTVSVPLMVVIAPDAVRLGRIRDRLVAAPSDPARADAVARLLSLVDARDAVIITTGATGELVARLYTAAEGLARPRVIGDDIAGVVRPLRSRVGPRPEPGVPANPKASVASVPWWRERWVKATLGTTAGAIVIGLVAVIVTRDPGTSTLGGVDIE
jgi:hypothetical protein